MADHDAVTWIELKEHCTRSQATCRELQLSRQETHTLQIETERREGMTELSQAIELMRAEISTIKDMLSSKTVFVIPRPILYIMGLGLIGAGMAGEKAIALILKYFGG